MANCSNKNMEKIEYSKGWGYISVGWIVINWWFGVGL